MRATYVCLLLGILAYAFSHAGHAGEYPHRLLWGDTHVHTSISNDAYMLGNNSLDPETAYRFAKGAPVIHPWHRAKVQLHRPLDFLVIADHAEYLGLAFSILELEDERLTGTVIGERLLKLKADGEKMNAAMVFAMSMIMNHMPPDQRPDFSLKGIMKMIMKRFSPDEDARDRAAMPLPDIGIGNMWFVARNYKSFYDLANEDVLASNWARIVEAADRHNAPGEFSALIGWEYGPNPEGKNLHRVIITPVDAAAAKQFFPYGFTESMNPEDLWAWLQKTHAETGIDFVSIPHNANLSKGLMFARTTYAGDPIDAGYASLRSRWETVAEISQIKGTSETHPVLSPTDEFANFEIYKRGLPGDSSGPSYTGADYVRPALGTGLELERQLGVNPFKLGIVGSTDSHTGLAAAEEDEFMGKFAIDSIPENKEEGFFGNPGWLMSGSGMAAVWATDNTREEIFAAFKRREVYGTSGPRISLRFFAGRGFDEADLNAGDLAAAGYRKGVPMGANLPAGARAPSFLVRAVKDPAGANLDRIQVVKGWLDAGGRSREKVFDVAWSGDRAPGADGKLPPVGDTVDRRTASYTNSIGAPELAALWQDPDYDPAARAFYYVRVLQIPTPRNSLYDSVALQAPPPRGYPEVIRERAWSSPIWLTPTGE